MRRRVAMQRSVSGTVSIDVMQEGGFWAVHVNGRACPHVTDREVALERARKIACGRLLIGDAVLLRMHEESTSRAA